MTDASPDIRPRGFADGFGVLLSQICLIHCFLLPALLAVLPSVNLHAIPGGEALHFGILLLATPTAIYALLTGFRFHEKMHPVVLGALGLALLWIGAALDVSHALLNHSAAHTIAAAGSILLVLAHMTNRWQVRRSDGCGCGHAH